MAKNIKIGTTTYSGVAKISVKSAADESVRFSFVDTTDANATTSDIISTKTAYVNGNKLTGTALSEETMYGNINSTAYGTPSEQELE